MQYLKDFRALNNGKFDNHNLEKLCPRSLALASTIPVYGLERVRRWKVAPWPWVFFFVSVALKVVFSTPPLQNKQ